MSEMFIKYFSIHLINLFLHLTTCLNSLYSTERKYLFAALITFSLYVGKPTGNTIPPASLPEEAQSLMA